MRIHRSLLAAGVLLAAVGISRADTISFSGGIVPYTVPTTGTYDIIAIGAGGGGGSGIGSTGGVGGIVMGSFSLTAGQVLNILVGKLGDKGLVDSGGGGGGTFVVDSSNNPLLIAGGGGGTANSGNKGKSAGGIETSGGNGGNGGTSDTSGTGGGGGGGLTGDGVDGDSGGGHGGKAFINGGTGGSGAISDGGGGFGGGGGGGGPFGGGGGGGGYTGGDGGVQNGFPFGGFGGTSFDADPNGTFSLDTVAEDGSVSITLESTTSSVPLPVSAEAGAALLGAVGLMKFGRRRMFADDIVR